MPVPRIAMHLFWCKTPPSVACSQMGARPGPRPSSLFSPGYDELVRHLVAMREDSRLIQQELASRLDRHRSFVWKTEGGQRRLDIVEFVGWCRACGADPITALRRFLKASG